MAGLSSELLDRISQMIRDGRYAGGFHATMRQLQRGLTSQDIEAAIGRDAPEIVEDYPEDPRGSCCLVRGELDDGRVLHVLCTPTDPVFLITCYWPDPDPWDVTFRFRRS